MAVSKEQAIAGGMFHYGPRCDEKHRTPAIPIERWRSNGKCHTWKTKPEEFRLPIKHGLRTYHSLTQYNAEDFHREADCPYGYV